MIDIYKKVTKKNIKRVTHAKTTSMGTEKAYFRYVCKT